MIRASFKTIVVFLITAYQQILSPDTGAVRYLGFSKGGVCRFEPSCSEYTKRAVISHGLVKGMFLGARQVLRCHPFRV
ncbi:MAG: membrane protein insertion efficiency factor YidD [Parcubacteria group bacterium]|nr:membrane protein insertion efficiency factor YidD [Parcubacteria group bacterium]